MVRVLIRIRKLLADCFLTIQFRTRMAQSFHEAHFEHAAIENARLSAQETRLLSSVALGVYREPLLLISQISLDKMGCKR